MKVQLNIIPISLEEANAFVAEHHRHHAPVVGHKFSVALSDGERVRGVGIVGRPVSRMLDDGGTLEVLRCCTDGAPNACSKLYSACWRAAFWMGYRRMVTYILDTEHGATLNAAGWRCVGKAGGGKWSRADRPRVDLHPTQGKLRFEVNK